MILRQKKQKLVLHHIVMGRCVNARKKKILQIQGKMDLCLNNEPRKFGNSNSRGSSCVGHLGKTFHVWLRKTK